LHALFEGATDCEKLAAASAPFESGSPPCPLGARLPVPSCSFASEDQADVAGVKIGPDP